MATNIMPIKLAQLGNSMPMMLPVKSTNSNTGLQVVLYGNGTYNVQISMYDPQWTNANIYPEYSLPGSALNTLYPTGVYDTDAQFSNHSTLNNLVTSSNTVSSQIGNLMFPCYSIRLNCTSYNNGYAILIVQPSAYPG